MEVKIENLEKSKSTSRCGGEIEIIEMGEIEIENMEMGEFEIENLEKTESKSRRPVENWKHKIRNWRWIEGQSRNQSQIGAHSEIEVE